MENVPLWHAIKERGKNAWNNIHNINDHNNKKLTVILLTKEIKTIEKLSNLIGVRHACVISQ